MNPRGMRNSPLLLPAVAGLALCLCPLSAGGAAAAESVKLQIELSETPAPGAAGTLRVTGRFDHPRFAVDDCRQLEVAAGGKALPLEIESSSMVKEFGRVVSVRLSFTVERAALEAAGGGLTLSWGPDVRGRTTLVERLSDEAAAVFTWERFARPEGGASDESFASLEVVAESGAEHTYLWYLLPMGLLLALLTVRKFVSA